MGRQYKIRNLTRGEFDIAVEWARAEGWNPGIHDAKCFYAMDPEGFCGGFLDGEMIASISGVRYGDTYSFLGFYIVKKEFRGKGYGMKLFEHIYKFLGKRNKGGDGVLENLNLYERVGLKLDHYNARYKGYGTGTKYCGEGIISAQEIPFEQLLNYDTKVFGFDREPFLKCWINQPESSSFCAMKGGLIVGWGAIRKCFTGYKIGPLFANDKKIADELYLTLAGQVGKKDEVFLDTPEINNGAVAIAEKYKMEKVFATGRIYTDGRPPSIKLEKWFGVTSFELG